MEFWNFGAKLTHLCGFWLDVLFFSHLKKHRSRLWLDFSFFTCKKRNRYLDIWKRAIWKLQNKYQLRVCVIYATINTLTKWLHSCIILESFLSVREFYFRECFVYKVVRVASRSKAWFEYSYVFYESLFWRVSMVNK